MGRWQRKKINNRYVEHTCCLQNEYRLKKAQQSLRVFKSELIEIQTQSLLIRFKHRIHYLKQFTVTDNSPLESQDYRHGFQLWLDWSMKQNIQAHVGKESRWTGRCQLAIVWDQATLSWRPWVRFLIIILDQNTTNEIAA